MSEDPDAVYNDATSETVYRIEDRNQGKMSEDNDAVYNDATSETGAVGNNIHNQDRSLSGEYSNSTSAIYFELERSEASTVRRNSNNSSSSNSIHEDEDDITQEPKMKRISTLIKSKIDVLSRAEKFGGKKNSGKGQKTEDVLPTNNSKVQDGEVQDDKVQDGKAQDLKAQGKHQQNRVKPQAGLSTEESNYSFCNPSAENITVDKNVADDSPGAQYNYGIQSENVSSANATSSVYELASPVLLPSKRTDTIKSTSSITSSANKGCLEGVGKAVPVDFITPHPNPSKDGDNNTEYEKLYFKSVDAYPRLDENAREMLKKRGYGSLASIKSEISKNSERLSEQEFESNENSENDDDISYWGSEFDDVSLQERTSQVAKYEKHEAPDKPLPPKPGKKPFMLRTKSSPCDLSYIDDPHSTSCLPVIINSEKHPPPVLPPQPKGLTQNQMKRRMIVESIINSERSYLESLERVIKDYEKTVLEAIAQSKSGARRVFSEMREIISHHKMFQIELSECVNRWDTEEKIGDIFTASFSKTMLVNAYSTYVNNFAAAMEEIRTLQRNRQAFQDFLQKQEKLSHDRLSIFGLMVKPVQRFPQFIMFLQDLIKYTPQDHHDRRALQLALTELENVAYKLNERKRLSEQKFQANQTIQQLIKQKVQHVLTSWNLDLDPKRRLIRTDSVEQVLGEFESLKCKNRRLILMNDLLLCVKVTQKEQSNCTVERLVLRWVAKLKDLELKDTVITPDMLSVVKREPGKINIISAQPEKPENDPFHLFADLHEMVHDHTVLGQISALLSTLKRSYTGHGLSDELVHEVSRDLQKMIQIKEEQLRLVNSCSIILQDNSRSDKPHYVLQTQTSAIKQDWCMDFLMAKLALDRSNSLAWDGTISSDGTDFDVTPVYFMKHLPVDVPKNYTKIRCAVSIFLNPVKSAHGIGVQHLWVCSSTPSHGQVSVLSVHNSKPSLMESFKACSSEILAVELVPGCGDLLQSENFLFPEDSVWLTTAHRETLIFPLISRDEVHRKPLAVLRTPAVTASLKFVDERLFCGFDDGYLMVYSRKADGSWNVLQPNLLTFGTSCVKLHFVHEENIWLSCANKLFQLEIDSLQTQATHTLNTSHMSPVHQIVKSGVGIWVSFHDSSVIRLFHIETMENLQEISIGNFVNRIRTEKLWTLSGAVENLVVTCLTVSRGLLWVGTSIGVVLTVPLPRLSDGVPLYRGHPKISLHAHKGPVRFLIPMHCSTSFLELNRASSLRSTLHARPSRRNQEREKLELEESEKRQGNTKNLVTVDAIYDGLPSGSENFNSTSSIPSSSRDAEVSISSSKTNDINVPNKSDQTAVGKSEKSTESSKKSKTISFRTELAQRIINSSTLSRSSTLSDSVEPLEVEELYEILLENEADLEEVDSIGDPDMSTQVSDKKSSSESIPLALSSETGSNMATPSWLNMAPPNHTKEPIDQGSSSAGAQATSTQSASSILASTISANNLETTRSGSPPLSPFRRPFRGGTSRLTTLRKASCNAVIILSGGDGYRDLDLSRSQAKMDDACVLLWVHKF